MSTFLGIHPISVVTTAAAIFVERGIFPRELVPEGLGRSIESPLVSQVDEGPRLGLRDVENGASGSLAMASSSGASGPVPKGAYASFLVPLVDLEGSQEGRLDESRSPYRKFGIGHRGRLSSRFDT